MEKKKVITKKEILNERLDNSAYADRWSEPSRHRGAAALRR